jgi:uncharacterized RmlC-like cupin family protein
MTIRTPQIQRLPNGTIDIGYYQNRARLERKRAFFKSSQSLSGIAGAAWPVVAATLILAAAVTIPHAANDTVASGVAITAAF